MHLVKIHKAIRTFISRRLEQRIRARGGHQSLHFSPVNIAPIPEPDRGGIVPKNGDGPLLPMLGEAVAGVEIGARWGKCGGEVSGAERQVEAAVCVDIGGAYAVWSFPAGAVDDEHELCLVELACRLEGQILEVVGNVLVGGRLIGLGWSGFMAGGC